MYQTFISYRRCGGSEYAARLYDYLHEKNFAPFYDITEMECGRFDEQIRITLINAQNFLASSNELNHEREYLAGVVLYLGRLLHDM